MRHKPSCMVHKIDGVGVDLSRFYPVSSVGEKISLRREKNYSEHDFMLIYTAEFIPRKNHRLLFDILPGLRERIPGLKAVLCGKGELLGHYRSLAERQGMDYVLFTGYTKDVADWCRMADVLVMPSLQEGLPMAMIEAIATGLPVVASDIRGHRDVIADCVNGFLFAPDDRAGFSRAIFALYNNPALRADMGQRNVMLARRYGVGAALDGMAGVYGDLIADGDCLYD